MWTIACERFGACFVDCITSGRYRAALAVAERFCTCAAKSTDPADGPIGDRLVGVALLALGDLKGARRHIERMLSGYVARGSHIIRFQYDQAGGGAFVSLPRTLAAGICRPGHA